MKNYLIIGIVLLVSASALAGHFDIEDPNGGLVEPSDTIHITNSNTFFPQYFYSDAHYKLYYQGSQIARVHVPFDDQFFYYDNVTLKIYGYGNLYVGTFIWTDEIEVEINLASPGKPQYSFYSNNTLPVNAQGPVFPSLSVYGIVLLIAGISLFFYNKP